MSLLASADKEVVLNSAPRDETKLERVYISEDVD